MHFRTPFIAVLLLLLTLPVASWSKQAQLVAGAGPSTKVAELFFQHFSSNPACTDYEFAVMPSSIKHKGGLLSSDKYLFGRTGRPLNAAEKKLGKAEILLGLVPISFVVGLETGTAKINLPQLEKIFTRKLSNWSDVGGANAPILLAGREESEALFLTLKKKLPFFSRVEFDKIFKRDNEVVTFLQSPAGAHAIGFGAKPNFSAYNQLQVEGFSTGVPIGLVYDLKQKDHPVIKAALKYANSREWKSLLSSISMLPAN